MIRGFKSPQLAEPLGREQLQWMPALTAGVIAGVVLLIVPHASPWEGLTSFSPAIVGRVVPLSWNVPALGAIVIHLCLSVIYGVIVSVSVMKLRKLSAVLLGGVVGLVLYFLNLGVVSIWAPELRGDEASVLVTHVVFGLIAAGAYRGSLRRMVTAA